MGIDPESDDYPYFLILGKNTSVLRKPTIFLNFSIETKAFLVRVDDAVFTNIFFKNIKKFTNTS
ncbi:hypothetical protein EO95_09445 [Methanosarcina sp. 1.H.T.1A.1]|nr:hypothetical protein EO95_09445 [Methanosarcina sp. 1.H.T.1A.1]